MACHKRQSLKWEDKFMTAYYECLMKFFISFIFTSSTLLNIHIFIYFSSVSLCLLPTIHINVAASTSSSNREGKKFAVWIRRKKFPWMHTNCALLSANGSFGAGEITKKNRLQPSAPRKKECFMSQKWESLKFVEEKWFFFFCRLLLGVDNGKCTDCLMFPTLRWMNKLFSSKIQYNWLNYGVCLWLRQKKISLNLYLCEEKLAA